MLEISEISEIRRLDYQDYPPSHTHRVLHMEILQRVSKESPKSLQRVSKESPKRTCRGSAELLLSIEVWGFSSRGTSKPLNL